MDSQYIGPGVGETFITPPPTRIRLTIYPRPGIGRSGLPPRAAVQRTARSRGFADRTAQGRIVGYWYRSPGGRVTYHRPDGRQAPRSEWPSTNPFSPSSIGGPGVRKTLDDIANPGAYPGMFESWKGFLSTITFGFAGYSLGNAMGIGLGHVFPKSAGALQSWSAPALGKTLSYVSYGVSLAGRVGIFDMSDQSIAFLGGLGGGIGRQVPWLDQQAASVGEVAGELATAAGKAIVDAGKSILTKPIARVSYNPSWWEELTGRPFFDGDWDWWQELYP